MNRWRNKIVLCCLVATFVPLVIQSPGRLLRKAFTAETAGQLSRTATSTITSGLNQFGEVMFTTTNRRFNLVRVSPNHDQHEYSLLLLEEFRTEGWPDEIVKATVMVEAWTGDFPNLQKKAWTIQAEGHSGETERNFYKLTHGGCCNSLTTQLWFSLIDGQKVFSSTINPIKVGVPNSKADLIRYVAWHSRAGITQPEERETVPDLQGVLQYCSERKTIQRVLVRSGLEPDPMQAKLTFRYDGKLYDETLASEQGLSLWKVNRQTSKTALSDFSIVLTLNQQFEVEIPVENDELQIPKARLPARIKLEAVR